MKFAGETSSFTVWHIFGGIFVNRNQFINKVLYMCSYQSKSMRNDEALGSSSSNTFDKPYPTIVINIQVCLVHIEIKSLVEIGTM